MSLTSFTPRFETFLATCNIVIPLSPLCNQLVSASFFLLLVHPTNRSAWPHRIFLPLALFLPKACYTDISHPHCRAHLKIPLPCSYHLPCMPEIPALLLIGSYSLLEYFILLLPSSESSCLYWRLLLILVPLLWFRNSITGLIFFTVSWTLSLLPPKISLSYLSAALLDLGAV